VPQRRKNPARPKPDPSKRRPREAIAANGRKPTTGGRADEERRTLWARLARSPWLIAVAAPIITAAALGTYHMVSSRITASFTPPLSAYVSYDTSRTYVWTMSYSHLLEPRDVPASIQSCAAMRQWLLAAGAADIAESDIRLHLVGTENSTVTVSGVHAQILSRMPASSTALLDCPTAGTVATPTVALDLRQDAPEAMEVKPLPPGILPTGSLIGRLGASFFTTHTITLTKGEPFDISITGFTAGTASVHWRVIVDYEINGQQHSIAASGPTFTTAPLLCGKTYDQYWQWDWSSSPGHLVRASPADGPSCGTDTLPY
jgi:hypothetical protein